MRFSARVTYDLEGIAAESASGCKQSVLSSGVSCLMGNISREQTRNGFGCHCRV